MVGSEWVDVGQGNFFPIEVLSRFLSRYYLFSSISHVRSHYRPLALSLWVGSVRSVGWWGGGGGECGDGVG